MKKVFKILMCVVLTFMLVTQYKNISVEAIAAETTITSSTTISTSIVEDVYISLAPNDVADEIVVTIDKYGYLNKLFAYCCWEEGDTITIINNGVIVQPFFVEKGVTLYNNNKMEAGVWLNGGKVVLDTPHYTSFYAHYGGILELLNDSELYGAYFGDYDYTIIGGENGIKVHSVMHVENPLPDNTRIIVFDYTMFHNECDIKVEYTDGKVYTIEAGKEYDTFESLFPVVCDKKPPEIKNVPYPDMAMSDNFELVITDDALASVKINSVEQQVTGNEFRKVLVSENGVKEYKIEAMDDNGNKVETDLLVIANWLETTSIPPLDTQIYLSSKYLYVNYDGNWTVEGDDTIYSYELGYTVVESGYYTLHKE